MALIDALPGLKKSSYVKESADKTIKDKIISEESKKLIKYSFKQATFIN
jgi:hypothetical protein